MGGLQELQWFQRSCPAGPAAYSLLRQEQLQLAQASFRDM